MGAAVPRLSSLAYRRERTRVWMGSGVMMTTHVMTILGSKAPAQALAHVGDGKVRGGDV